MMQRIEKQEPARISYIFTEQEFKDKLGIDDPNGVIQVSCSFTTREITVRLSTP